MYLIELKYKVNIDVVLSHVDAHREFLAKHYQAGNLLVSGPKDPREGGVIIALFKDRQHVDTFVAEDPFNTEGVADYQVSEFQARWGHPVIKELLDSTT